MSLYTKLCTLIAKCIFKKSSVSYEIPPEEGETAVYLCNHSGAFGPANMTLWFDKPHMTWLINYTLNKKKNANFVYHDFFFGRSRKCKPFWRALSKIVAVFLRPLLLDSKPIPVYHDMRITSTFDKSLNALQNGENIVIFPECPTKYSEFINDIYSGFADLGRTYANQTGKALKFYPVYVAHPLHKILIGKPISYNTAIPPKLQRDDIAKYVRDNIDRMARSLPPHKPAPFLPQIWYDYYGEYENDVASYWKLFE